MPFFDVQMSAGTPTPSSCAWTGGLRPPAWIERWRDHKRHWMNRRL
jgi:hypothetical protein